MYFGLRLVRKVFVTISDLAKRAHEALDIIQRTLAGYSRDFKDAHAAIDALAQAKQQGHVQNCQCGSEC